MSKEDTKVIEQPKLKGGVTRGQPRFFEGGKRSVAVLKNLGFDPIGKLVERYNEIEKEVQYWKGIRNRTIIEVINAEGKERYYDSDAHMQAEKMLCDIGDKLLRYGYGRVPETVNVNDNRPPPLVINLTQEGGKQHFINNDPDYIEHDDEGT